jgi:hypothetical protein
MGYPYDSPQPLTPPRFPRKTYENKLFSLF